MKFVWLDVPGGGEIPVNPDQVAYLRAGQGDHQGLTEVVFGGFAGGLHSVTVSGEGRAVALMLELGNDEYAAHIEWWGAPARAAPEPPARPDPPNAKGPPQRTAPKRAKRKV